MARPDSSGNFDDKGESAFTRRSPRDAPTVAVPASYNDQSVDTKNRESVFADGTVDECIEHERVVGTTAGQINFRTGWTAQDRIAEPIGTPPLLAIDAREYIVRQCKREAEGISHESPGVIQSNLIPQRSPA